MAMVARHIAVKVGTWQWWRRSTAAVANRTSLAAALRACVCRLPVSFLPIQVFVWAEATKKEGNRANSKARISLLSGVGRGADWQCESMNW